MDLINAHEAREISKKNNIEGIIEEIGKMIIESAESGESILQIRDFGFGDSDLYSWKFNEKQEEIINILRSYGYSAKLTFEERKYVDIYLEISW